MVSIGKQLHFLPLGGSGEIGMNLNLYGYDGKWLMVDMGVSFMNQWGVEVMMPDTQFIEERKKNLLGIVLTHGHEDHIGAVPYLWGRLRCPIYATPFTAALVREKLKEAGFGAEDIVVEIPLSGTLELDVFKVTFFSLTHSIPEPNGLLIESPAGSVFHTGDWKIDADPLVGASTDISGLRELGNKNVLAMLCDSTNVFYKSEAGSEKTVQDNLETLIARYKGHDSRLFITCFASNLARLYAIGKAAQASGRVVGLFGRSMERMDRIARQQGYLSGIPPFLSAEEVMKFPAHKGVILTTGSQGEPRAGLKKIISGMIKSVKMRPKDVMIFSARIIPGNEYQVGQLQNELVRQGVSLVVPSQDDLIHVSGHPGQEELRQMYEWIRPQIAIPVHGELRHLVKQAELATQWGVPHTFIPENGMLIRITPQGAELVQKVHAGRLVIDHGATVAADHPAIRERAKMSYNGALFATVFLGRGQRLERPTQVTSQGLHLSPPALEEIRKILEQGILDLPENRWRDDAQVAEAAGIAMRRMTKKFSDQKPATMVHVVRLG